MLKKIFYILTTLFLVTASVTDAKGYYNTRGRRPVVQKAQPTYTQNQIDNAWIKVPWSNGGYYYHNTLTREDIDTEPGCLTNRN